MKLSLSASASQARTLLELLEERAESRRESPLFTFVEDSPGDETVLSNAELLRRARRIGAALQQVTAAGERAVLLYPPGLEYVAGFFGCMAAGVVAVPAYPPDPTRLERTLPRLRAIIQDAQATVVLTTSFILSMGEMLFETAPDLKALRWLATDELAEGTEEGWKRPELERDSLAFLQYTSGSTGTPKGVELSHGNLLHNLKLIHGAFRMHEGSAGVIWLPPYHDMGLIGGILGTVYGGFSTSLMSPMTFLRRPLRWLEELSRTGGTISGGPNFAFDLCVRKTTEAERAALDLSRWEVAFCGAEPIRPETLERFAQAFACSGFRREAFYPCYGLAEATLIVSGGDVGAPTVLQPLDAERLREGRVVPAEPTQAGAQTLVGCGRTLQEQELLVVHPERHVRCAPGEVGEVWVKGPSVARGYWARPEDTQRDFHARTADGAGPFLRTGDQGFLQDGQLFVTGRLKDLIIIRGRNHHPQDLELTAEQSSRALRAGCGAAFSVEQEGEERLVLVYEADTRRQPLEMDAVVREVRQRVAEAHELQLHALVLIEPGNLPKTSSGKIQRRATRAAWLAGELRVVETWEARRDADAPASARPSPAAVEEARPQTLEALEQWLRTRLAQRLKVAPEELERNEPLTRYGVDSLAAVEVTYEVEKGLGVALPMEALLSGPTLAGLAQRLWEGARMDALAPRTAEARERPLPLSFAQQRLWFLEQLEPGSPRYNLPAAVRLEGTLDAAALERCFTEVVRRHESLRTTFQPGHEHPVQHVADAGAVTLGRVDLSALPTQERDAEVLRRTYQEALRPFDLDHGPLLRTTLLRLSDSEHVLVLCMHHIVSDGWSMGVLVREVAALYEAFSQGRPSPLPALPVQYADYTLWQRQRLQGEVLDAQLAYWKKQLAGAPAQLELPTDRARPPVQDSRGASHPVRVSHEQWEKLQALARREGVTPFMLLLAAFQTLLHRYSGQDDLSIGSPIAGRGRAETEGLIGFFVNNLVLRTRLDGNPSFRELLARVRDVTLGAYAHQEVPFEKLVETLQPVRDMSRSPLFQVMLILHPDPLPGFRVPGLSLRGVELESHSAKYDLTLQLAESAEGLVGSLEYATSLYDAATAARMVQHLGVLLDGVLAHPEAPLSELPLLPEAEQRLVVETWNRALPAPVVDVALHQLFERQVERTPDATVLVVGTRRLTYRELDERANRLAWHLRSLGVGPGVPVALCLERTELLPVALFAILKAGGAYMPLDPTYPTQRLAFTLEDSRSPLLLTQRSLVPLARELNAPTLVLLDEPGAFEQHPGSRPPCLNGTGDLAYILYTSGSTGRPKGVALEHRSAVAFVRWALDTFTPAQLAGVLASTSVCFDLSVFELFVPPACGGCIYLADTALALPSLPAVSEVTLINTVPSAMAELVRQRAVPHTVHTVNLCGEPLTAPLAQGIHAAASVKVLYNLYGPTEDTTYSTWTAVAAGETATPHIGRPLPGTQAYVLDARLRPVPVGVPGELYLGGLGLARGYFGRPELTAERFVPDAFSTEPGARLYRTGDRVYWRADGQLEFLGRIDFQVKLRGFRIELGEVESVLLQHPSVRAVTAMAREDVPGDKRLVAYVVPRDGEVLDIAALRALVKQKLPEYMVPSAFVPMEAFPQTPNGKVDRKQLPVPEGSGLASAHEYTPPRTATEELLATLWAQVLLVPRVGRQDDFFALGGHSLLATQVMARVRSAFGVELPLRALFEAPTLEALAARLDAARQGATSGLPAPRRVERSGPPPLSFAQQRLWFLEQLTPGTATYNMPAAVRLQGPLDTPALQRSFDELVRRHEPLRTTFPSEAGQPVQVIAPATARPLPVVDLTHLSPEQREAEALRLAREDAQSGFDLSTGPLLRTTLLRLSETEHVLLLCMHHTVSDGWSLGVLVRELAALYGAFRQGQASPLPELPLRYADYALWQREWLRGDVLNTQLDYWKRQLSGAPEALELPTDRPRPPVLSSRGATLPVALPRELMESVKALCQREGVTPFMLLLAAFQTLLARYSGQEDVSVGTPIANRRHAGLEGLIGFFANTLVLRSHVRTGGSFRALLAQVRETTLGAYEHQDVPFEKLVDELQPVRDLSRTPLFQAMFSLQDTLVPTLHEAALTLEPLPVDAGVAKFELHLDVGFLADGGLAGGLAYNTDLFDESTGKRLVQHLRVLLEAAVARPEAPLDSLSLLTEGERQLLLEQWSGSTPSGLTHDVLVQELVAAATSRAPDARAVVCGERALTYGELSRQSHRLARHLRSLGVGPEVRVALCVERSPEMVVALLAILEAGGAYVPLDPAYPRERLALLVEDSRPRVLVTCGPLKELFASSPCPVVCLDADAAAISVLSDAPLASAQSPDSAAYVIYTSGSTGRPKGVVVSHRNLVHSTRARNAHYGAPPSAYLLLSSIAFDSSVAGIFWSLCEGGTLVLPEGDTQQDLHALTALIARERVSHLLTVPSFYRVLLEQARSGELGTLRAAIVAGESCPAALVQQHHALVPGAELHNEYGPTENSVWATVQRLAANGPASRVSIGRPIRDVSVYVLDEALRPVPAGVPGQLYLGGAGITRGYLDRPELTAERFIPDPFGARPGQRLYGTGDRVRFLADGTLDFLGRIDSQVKLRGFRIELGEVESALLHHPAVREVAAVVREDAPGDRRLVAYLVAREGQSLDTAALRSLLTQTLPEYMVPSAFVRLEALPLNPNGKLDRKALPAPAATQLASGGAFVAPRNEVEERLASIWSALLGVPRVGIHDNFFALGGDSIISLQVVARARQAGLLLSARELFQHQTVAQLAQVAKTASTSTEAQGPASGPVPLTPIQLHLLHHDPEHAHHFNQAVLLRTRQTLQAPLLQRALEALVSHHDALRLHLTRRDGAWHQEHAASEQLTVPLHVHDLSAMPAAERPAALREEASRLQASFRLSEAPLLRAALFLSGEGQPQQLFLCVHHLVVDAVSWRVLMEDLESVYQQLVQGRPVTLPPRSTSFQAWARHLESLARSEALAAEAPLWLESPQRPLPGLPLDASGANTRASERTVSLQLEQDETRLLLQETPAAWRARIDDVLLSALAQALAEWTGHSEVLVDLEGHGRQEQLVEGVDLSRTVGWFTTVAPVLLRLPSRGTPGEGLRSVRDSLRRLPHHGLGFGLLRWMGPEATAQALRARPDAPVLFNYLGQLDTSAAASALFVLTDEDTGPQAAPAGVRDHVLEVVGSVLGGRLRLAFRYSESLHSAATIERLAQRFHHHLRALISSRHSEDARRRSPGDFPLARVSPAALQSLLSVTGPELEDLYPVSPLQHGLLFHWMLSPGSDVYLEQLAWTMEGRLDLEAFRAAWQASLDGHSILRTSFHWEGLESPVQAVHARATLPFEVLDWRDVPAAEQPARFAKLLEEDRRRGFDPRRAPLMRLTAVRLGETLHRFLWNHHHLLLDGWSLGLVFQDVLAHYEAATSGGTARLESRAPFRDYISWLLGRREASADERFWRSALAGFTTPTPLPADTHASPPPGETPALCTHEQALDATATAALTAFSRQHQVTLNTLVLAAWALVLSRYSGQREVLFGTTVSGRPPELPGSETMVGVFINSLPIRVRLPSESSPLLPWLKSFQEQLAEVRQHDFAPLVDIQSWSQVPRGTQLFESLLVVENFPLDSALLQANTPVDIRDVLTHERANFPLGLAVVPGERLRLGLSHDEPRLRRDDMRRLLAHWRTALEGLVAHVHASLGDVSLLSDAERQQVLVEWSTAPGSRTEQLPHHLFEEQVRRAPDAPAVSFGAETLTYSELNARANQLARHLRRLGVGPEVLVSVFLERSVERVVALLAINKAGGAWLALDPSLPEERLAYITSDALTPVRLTHSSLEHLLDRSGFVFLMDDHWERVERESEEDLDTRAVASSLAYVIYTSGSTGRPKGTLLTQGGLANTARQVAVAHGYRPDSRVLQFANVAFDASVAEVFSTLVAGACLCLADPEQLMPSEPLRSLLEQQSITAVTLTPSVLAQLEPQGLPKLETVISAGEACTPELARRWSQGRRLLNAYGPTEITICATVSGPVKPERLGIGRALPQVQVYVLDASLRPVPVGVAGELYVGGAGVARGYLGQPALTAERFIPHPFSTEPGARLYRTGDEVRWMVDGELEFLGRRDEQVKLRGFRIELGEVESVLAEHPSVAQAVVALREDAPGDKRLVAYVVPRPGEQAEPQSLRAALLSRLPDYMVPAAFVSLESLPLTTSGKVDKKALPAPEGAHAVASSEYVAPRTDLERRLAAIWSELLDVEQVGLHDEFMSLGGHSLLATQVMARIRANFGVELPLRVLFESATLEKLATQLEAAVTSGSRGPKLPPLERASREQPLPLSFAQQRLWFLEQLEPGRSTYNMPAAIRVEGPLDVAALERCLTELVSRHEVLRTTYRTQGGEARQVIGAPTAQSLRRVDLGALPTAAREVEAQRLAREEGERPFDLATGPLLRATLLKLTDTEHLLVVVMHHIVSDGWSITVLIRELSALYAAFVQGQPSPLPELAVQYADYAVWQRQWLVGEELERQLSYWKQQLAGAPPVLELPTDRPRPSVQSFRGTSLPLGFSKELSGELKALAQREGVTPFMLVLTVFQVLLHRYSGQDDVSVGSPIAGRRLAELEGLAGFFVNSLVLRTRMVGNPTFRELLKQVRETTLGAYAHQDIPFEKLVEDFQPERNLSHSPLFQVWFHLDEPRLADFRTGDLTMRVLEGTSDVVKFDLALFLTDYPEGIAGTFDYNTDLFDESTLARMAAHLGMLLEGVVASPDTRVSELSLQTEAQRQQVLVEWNEARRELPAPALVHRLFEEQVRRAPDAPAVSFGAETLTYEELNSRANQLARHLRRLGVGPEVLVAVCLERSVELVVALLAINKAGGAWLPLDPTLPAERLSYITSDAFAPVLLTHSSLEHLLDRRGFVFLMDDHWERVERESEEDLDTTLTGDNLAYVIYTSGSTGRPKGTLLQQRGLTNTALQTVDFMDLGPGQRLLQFFSISFDASVSEVFPALLSGACLVMASRDELMPGAPLLKVVEEQSITTLKLTPSVLAQLEPESLRGVRTLTSAGEACTPELVARWKPGRRFVNAYGPTETTVCASVNTNVDPRHVTLGRPFHNVKAYVLDAHQRPVPVGVPGELYIGGVGLARGYHGRPELTAERFVPDAFSTEPGARLYRTGDRVRWLARGELEYLGRVDFQVKLRGFRIELGEVESVLQQHPLVREAVVVVREDAPGRKRLVAYVVAREGQEVDTSALRSALSGTLPEYMVPAAIVVLEALPLNSSGKVDRKALPAPEATGGERESNHVAPRDDVEQRLADIWAQVLGIPKVGVHDNFFTLGGDSIISLQVVSRARQVGLVLATRDLFQHQTVAQLAQVVKTASTSTGDQGPVTGPVPLTPIQRYLLQHDAAHAHHFNQSVLLANRVPLEASLLEGTLRHLLGHHDALRLRLRQVDGEWRQDSVAPEECAFQLVQVDLSALPEHERAAALEAEATRLQASFVLSEPPLLRAALFQLGAGQQRLLLAVHHLAVDAVSWRVLLEDLESTYLQLEQGQQVMLPARSTSFQAWARRLESHAGSPALEAESALWLDEARQHVAPLPADATGPNTRASERSISVALEAEETKLLLQEVPSAWRAHINDVLLTALAQALAGWTGQSHVLVDVEGHGREELFPDVDLSRTVGWFTSLTPVLLPAPSGVSTGDGLRAVRDSLRRLPHHGLGFGLLRWMGPADTATRLQALPTAQVAFNYLGQLDATVASSRFFSLADEPIGPLTAPSGTRFHPLEVNGSVLGGCLRVSFGYSESLHSAATIEQLAQRFVQHLRDLISSRHSEDARRFTPSDFPLAPLTPPALDALLRRTGPDVEDIYPLSPMQQGMLFHALLAPESGTYFEQLAWTVRGELDLEAFLQAWRTCLGRHSILRSSFHWEALESPLQVVHAHVELPFESLDWRELTASAQQARFEQLLREEKQRGFDLNRAPLTRLTAVRLTGDTWRFLWSHHHLLVDGWSLGVLIGEVFSLYDTLRAGSAPRPVSPRPFRDYIAWLQRRDTPADTAWWRSYLAGFSAPTPLPADTRAAPPPGSHPAPQLMELDLSPAATAALQAFARQHQLTAHTLALAAWALVLSRYSGEQDVLFGNTVAGRPAELPGSESMVGLFINSLPTRVRIPSATAPLLPWLQALQAAQLEQRQYEHTPLVQIQAASAVPRGTPLFESLVVFENYPLDTSVLSSPSLKVEDVQGFEATNYPLTLSVLPGEALRLRAVYESPRFERAGLEQVLRHWRNALEGLASGATCLDDVRMLSEAERRQVVVEWNPARTDFPGDACIHHLFEQQAALRPEAIALEFGDEKLTYAQLDARANQLAHLLRARGVREDDLVALCLERSVELIVSLLAILKAGGAYVPLDPSYPAERLGFMLEDAPPRLLLTSRALHARLPVLEQIPRLLVEELALEGQPTTAPHSGAGSRNLAYVDFTSGSTGRPKGVAIEHRSVMRLLHGNDYAHLGPDETFLLIAPISFDASTLEVWGPLLFGGRLVVFPPQSPSDLDLLTQVLARHRVTTLHLTSGLFSQVVDLKLEGLKGVRQLLTGGDVVSAPHVRRVLEELRIPVTACYGPTESTLFTSCHRMTQPEQVGSAVPIGTPIANTQVYLLDDSLQPVPVGVPGALFIGGEGLARGYLSRPDLTAERFLPNPFSTEPGARLYRTGDLARWRQDGVLEFLGRQDNQVKVRGYRVELAEVEAAVLRHAPVREAVAMVREDVPGDKRLVVYAVPHPDQTLDIPALRTFLQERLPEYMVPSTFVTMEALPLTANAKVDRKALPAPEGSRPTAATYVAPRDEMEQEVARLWSEVLGVERVGVHDDFLSLGGHSLLATRLVSRVRQAFQVELPLKDFFAAPTVEKLSLRLLEAMAQVPGDELASMMDELERMDGDEVEQLLASTASGADEMESQE
ncbi:non-ribosomal peptide synthase/polyketide synthase [Pyxidicoccus parkwayensis]|uniref:Non-ribosomal peptide synthase/polyketide synthase n=1 Tax=Pyxidicoccus parkwayensis TaxID=2813578 RepID=A0ABX7P1J8_9BACT|nr:non-ribosomal peptide synthase/polyketide synthase [Pyxidicoccus parkwaysis]QSQ23764.1 non-ribosomal peptide synthase/polyketide synthase [Pyxidicoccus parkwaysis]